MYLPHKCINCGQEGESMFNLSGPHIKQTCIHCGAYVKFRRSTELPSVELVRLKIWEVSGKNVDLIEEAKYLSGFVEMENLMLSFIHWWHVYLKLLTLLK